MSMETGFGQLVQVATLHPCKLYTILPLDRLEPSPSQAYSLMAMSSGRMLHSALSYSPVHLVLRALLRDWIPMEIGFGQTILVEKWMISPMRLHGKASVAF